MRARDVAFIRKLCTLGLPPRSLVLSLLPALRELVPAHSAGVFWVDAAAQMTSLYAERLLPPDAMAAYHERHYGDQKDGFAAAFRARAEAEDPVSWHSFTRREQASDYFRDVLKPLDSYHVLYAVLSDGRRPFAQLSLYRGERDRPFGPPDAQALRGLLRYLAVGLAEPDRPATRSEESVVVEEQLGIVTNAGEIVSGSDEWKRLVRLGAVARVSPGEAARERGAIEDFLRELTGRAHNGARGSCARPRGDASPCPRSGSTTSADGAARRSRSSSVARSRRRCRSCAARAIRSCHRNSAKSRSCWRRAGPIRKSR
jgi:hypothetical protein